MRRDSIKGIADLNRRSIASLIVRQAMSPNALTEHVDRSRQSVTNVSIGKTRVFGKRNLLSFKYKKLNAADN